MKAPLMTAIVIIFTLSSCTNENYELIEGEKISTAFILNSSATFRGYFYKGSDEDYHYFIEKWKYFGDDYFKLKREDLKLYCTFNFAENSEIRIDVIKTDKGGELGGNEYYTIYTVNIVYCPEDELLQLKDYHKLKTSKGFDFYCTKDCENETDANENDYKIYNSKDHIILFKDQTNNKISIEFLIVDLCCQKFFGDYEIVNDTLNIVYKNIESVCECLCKYQYRIDIKNRGNEINAIKINGKLAVDTLDDVQIDDPFENGQETKLFKRDLPFDIQTFEKAEYYPIPEDDSLFCENWKLTNADIEKIIKESDPITGYEWNQQFVHIACMYEGKIKQKGKYYNFELNAGGWFVIFEADTFYKYGSFKKENDKFFFSGVFDSEEK